MAILRIRDENGKVHEILAIRGEDYILTEQDKEEIASMISDSDGNGNFSALTDHKNDISNPHGVTAEQIGAVTQEELQDALDSLDIPEGSGGDPTALNAHIADNNNPHGVTCEQIGAATQTALAALNQYAMEEFERLEMGNSGHVFDTENPHFVTCEQIGAVTESAFTETVGDISSALDQLHSYAQGLVSGGSV